MHRGERTGGTPAGRADSTPPRGAGHRPARAERRQSGAALRSGRHDPPGGYNRYVRIVSALLLTLCLAGCNRGAQDKEAIRQAVAERLRGMNMPVDVAVTSVQIDGNQASAEVSITPKGAPAQKMSMPYKLEKRDGKWVVVGRGEGGSPHGGAMPGMENPHGGAVPVPGGPGPAGGKMPSPENLPPAGDKK